MGVHEAFIKNHRNNLSVQGGLGPVITGLPVGSTNGYMTPYMVSGTGLAMDSTPITTQQDQ